jgi:hypothetical protein
LANFICPTSINNTGVSTVIVDIPDFESG